MKHRHHALNNSNESSSLVDEFTDKEDFSIIIEQLLPTCKDKFERQLLTKIKSAINETQDALYIIPNILKAFWDLMIPFSSGNQDSRNPFEFWKNVMASFLTAGEITPIYQFDIPQPYTSCFMRIIDRAMALKINDNHVWQTLVFLYTLAQQDLKQTHLQRQPNEFLLPLLSTAHQLLNRVHSFDSMPTSRNRFQEPLTCNLSEAATLDLIDTIILILVKHMMRLPKKDLHHSLSVYTDALMQATPENPKLFNHDICKITVKHLIRSCTPILQQRFDAIAYILTSYEQEYIDSKYVQDIMALILNTLYANLINHPHASSAAPFSSINDTLMFITNLLRLWAFEPLKSSTYFRPELFYKELGMLCDWASNPSRCLSDTIELCTLIYLLCGPQWSLDHLQRHIRLDYNQFVFSFIQNELANRKKTVQEFNSTKSNNEKDNKTRRNAARSYSRLLEFADSIILRNTVLVAIKFGDQQLFGRAIRLYLNITIKKHSFNPVKATLYILTHYIKRGAFHNHLTKPYFEARIPDELLKSRLLQMVEAHGLEGRSLALQEFSKRLNADLYPNLNQYTQTLLTLDKIDSTTQLNGGESKSPSADNHLVSKSFCQEAVVSLIGSAFELCDRTFLYSDSQYQYHTLTTIGTWLLLSSQNHSSHWSIVTFPPAPHKATQTPGKPKARIEIHGNLSLVTGKVHIRASKKGQRGTVMRLASDQLTFKTEGGTYLTTDSTVLSPDFKVIHLLGNLADSNRNISFPHLLTLADQLLLKLKAYLKSYQPKNFSRTNQTLFNNRLNNLDRKVAEVKGMLVP